MDHYLYLFYSLIFGISYASIFKCTQQIPCWVPPLTQQQIPVPRRKKVRRKLYKGNKAAKNKDLTKEEKERIAEKEKKLSEKEEIEDLLPSLDGTKKEIEEDEWTEVLDVSGSLSTMEIGDLWFWLNIQPWFHVLISGTISNFLTVDGDNMIPFVFRCQANIALTESQWALIAPPCVATCQQVDYYVFSHDI